MSATLSVALDGVTDQIRVLEEARVLAIAASADDKTPSERSGLQTSFSDLLSAFEVIATSTEIADEPLLDGSYADRLVTLGDGEVVISLPDTRTVSLANIAEGFGFTVTTTALTDQGELAINGTVIGETSAAADLESTTNNDSSARAFADAINRADVGVYADAQDTVVNLGQISSGRFSSGSLTLNSVDIGAIDVQHGDSDGALAAAINAVSSDTGVLATTNATGEMLLIGVGGTNIVTAGFDTDGTGVLENDPGQATYTGSVVLTSSEQITVAGESPEIVGFVGETFEVDAGSGLSTMDISTEAGADAALRRIRIGLDELHGLRAELRSAQMDLNTDVQAYLSVEDEAASRGTLSAMQASETARLSRGSILESSDLAISAQASMSGQHVLSLLKVATSLS